MTEWILVLADLRGASKPISIVRQLCVFGGYYWISWVSSLASSPDSCKPSTSTHPPSISRDFNLIRPTVPILSATKRSRVGGTGSERVQAVPQMGSGRLPYTRSCFNPRASLRLRYTNRSYPLSAGFFFWEWELIASRGHQGNGSLCFLQGRPYLRL